MENPGKLVALQALLEDAMGDAKQCVTCRGGGGPACRLDVRCCHGAAEPWVRSWWRPAADTAGAPPVLSCRALEHAERQRAAAAQGRPDKLPSPHLAIAVMEHVPPPDGKISECAAAGTAC